MSKLKRILPILLVTCLPNLAHADEHDHGNFELGGSIGPAYVVDEGWSASVHFHAVWFIPDTPVGLGIGYERLFDDHNHNTVSFVSQFHIYAGWSAALAPGITWEEDAINASLHIETFYEFEINDYVHAGPSFELALDKHAPHLTPGLHMGIGF
jgi:hypothetical protein